MNRTTTHNQIKMLALVMLLLVTACQYSPVIPDQPGNETPTQKPWNESVTVIVQDRYTGQSRSGVKVAVLDALTNQLRALPKVTDQAGHTTFAALPAGHYAVVVFPGDELGVYNLPGSFYLSSTSNQKWPIGLVTGHSYQQTDFSSESPPDHEFYVQTYDRTQPGGLPRIQGMVVDANTGEMLVGAFVSQMPGFSAYLGQIDVWDDVTLSDGLFAISDIPFAQDPQSGQLFQVIPFQIMCEGYWPRPYLHQLASGDDNLDITDVIIEMSPEDESGSGILNGTLVCAGQPLSNVVVGLCYYGPIPELAGWQNQTIPHSDGVCFSSSKSNIGLPGKTSTTDHNGFFQFDGLLPGGYFPYPAYLPDSDYQFFDPENNEIRAVAAGETVAMGQLAMVQTVRQIWPAPAAILTDPVSFFAWTELKTGDSYLIYLDNYLIGTTDCGYFELPTGEAVTTGHHIWDIFVLDRNGTTMGLSKRRAYFSVQ